MVQSFSAAVRGAGFGTNLHVGVVVFQPSCTQTASSGADAA